MSTIAGVQARVAVIRSRLAVDSGNGADGSASLGATPGPGGSFDPFGAAYQAALGAASAAPTQSSAAPLAATDMTTATRVRSVGAGARIASASSSTRARGESLSGEQIANLAYNAGFRGDDLVNVVAISKRESNWTPSAYNGNAGTGDASYGLMQINMIGDLGPARLEQFGLSSYDQLLDPQTNMNAAFTLYTRSGNTLHAWGGYKGMSDTFGTDVAAARQVVEDAHLGG